MNIRIGGVYNCDIIQSLKKLNLNHFKFDLRPRSFNFTQISKIEEIFKNNILSSDHVTVCFEDDDELTIKESLKRIMGDLSFKDIYLEFYNPLKSSEFYDSFNRAYYLHINSNFDLKSLSEYKFLKCVVLHSKDIEQLINFNHIHNFLKTLEANLNEGQCVEFQMSWDDEVNSSLLNFYNIQSVSFDIDSKIESSYRNIDKDLMCSIITQNKKYIGDTVENIAN